MTKKTLDKLHAECAAIEKKEIEETTGRAFDDKDVETVNDICRAILDLRDKYQIGNFDTRDCADEINAVMPLMHNLLGMHDLYNAVLIEKNDDTGSKTRQLWKQKDPAYGIEADDNQLLKMAKGFTEQYVDLSKLNSVVDCIRWAKLESRYNWQNYKPGERDSPAVKQQTVYRGKLWELIFAMVYKDQIKEPPKIFSDKAVPKYDMTFSSNLKVDIKTFKGGELVEKHIEEYPDVAIYCPEDPDDTNNHNFIEIYSGNGSEKINVPPFDISSDSSSTVK